MLILLIWWCGIGLEAMIVLRGLKVGLFGRYLSFYIYVVSLFLTDGLLYLLYSLHRSVYNDWVWYPSFVVLFLGCGVVLETFRHVFARYAGAEKVARVGSLLIIGATVCFAGLYVVLAPSEATAHFLYVRLQRDFLTVQAILLLGILQVASYYSISLGKNLKALILGYGQCLAVTLAGLALRAYIGMRFEDAWSMMQQLSYLAALVTWLIGLWSYCPDPKPQETIEADGDYGALASRTRDMVSAASTQLVKAERL